MSYLSDLGINADETRIAELLFGIREINPFNLYLDEIRYKRFVRYFSLNKQRTKLDSIFNCLYNSPDGLTGCNNLEKILSLMCHPLQDPEVIARRQDIVTHFLNADEEEKELVNGLLARHSELGYVVENWGERENKKHFPRMIHPFMEIAGYLEKLERKYRGDALMGRFSKRIRKLFEEHPLLKKAYLFGWKRGRTLVSPREAVSMAEVSLKGTSSMNLGFFKQEGINFSLMKKYALDMEEFATRSAAFVSVFESFYYMARAFENARRKGIPTTMPKINNEGVFELRDGLPIATHVEETPVNVDFAYDRRDNHVILSGPHSGGKTELLKNIGVYHVLALSGFPVPAEYANVPMTRRIITSFKKSAEKEKGSLESEINETAQTIKSLQQGDLVLLDEFLDTTKPELAAHLEEPLLEGFASSPATTILVSHRATSLKRDLGFRFMYPELKEVEVPKSCRFTGDSPSEDEEKAKILVPTHRFLIGKPEPELTRNHAFLMWEKIKERIRDRRYYY